MVRLLIPKLNHNLHIPLNVIISFVVQMIYILLSFSAAAVAPTFGCDLGSHIERNSSLTRSRLAFPLRLCVVRILQLDGLQEDGIFRVSAPATKIKRLSALIDAGECNDEDASYANDIYDVHVFAGTLKLYLRELPQALMCSTRDMYAEWMSACG